MAATRHFCNGIGSHRTILEASSRAHRGYGKLLPDGIEIIDFLEDQNSYSGGDFSDLVDNVIPQDFWTMQGIDWLANAVTAHGNCYCDVSMPVEVLMSLFPGDRTPVHGVEFVGEFLLVKSLRRATSGSPRDRRWDGLPHSHGRLFTSRSRTYSEAVECLRKKRQPFSKW